MKEKILDIYSKLPNAQAQVHFLLKLCFYLTISGRDTYVVQSNEVSEPVRLRGINELQHKTIGQILGIQKNTNKYPNDVFIFSIFDTANAYGCTEALEAALVAAME